jgi:3-oxoacyl-[acyl-carrier protein] reductase
MELDLKNKTALVCGSSQGLGFAVATELALLGANVILSSRNENKLQEAIKKLPAGKDQSHQFLALDLSQPATISKSIENILATTTIDILINNAGGPPSLSILDTPAEELNTAFQTHLISSHLLAQLCIPLMKKNGYGRIVNILSTSVKEPIKGLGISNSIRAAVANWAKTLSAEVAEYGITVNNVLPGYTATDRLNYLFEKRATMQGISVDDVNEQTVNTIPAKRLGQPHEFGAAVAFLCTPAAAYINGINLPVDGGRLSSL